MTPAQKKNVARFKAAAAEAKKIRAKDPKLTQAEAVKKAFAKLYGVKKTVAKKAVAKKAVAKNKPAIKKVGEYHKDTKSHNVNIRVVSGINGFIDEAKKRRVDLVHRITIMNKSIIDLKSKLDTYTPLQKSMAKGIILHYTKWVQSYKNELKIIDGLINLSLKGIS